MTKQKISGKDSVFQQFSDADDHETQYAIPKLERSKRIQYKLARRHYEERMEERRLKKNVER